MNQANKPQDPNHVNPDSVNPSTVSQSNVKTFPGQATDINGVPLDQKINGLSPAQAEAVPSIPPGSAKPDEDRYGADQTSGTLSSVGGGQNALGVLLISQGFITSSTVNNQAVWKFTGKAKMIPGIGNIDYGKTYSLDDACRTFMQAVQGLKPETLHQTRAA